MRCGLKKRKTAFNSTLTGRWTIRIDLRHYRDYCTVDDQSRGRSLLFLQLAGRLKQSSRIAHQGLFGEHIKVHPGAARIIAATNREVGMVYWAIDSLKSFGDDWRTWTVRRSPHYSERVR